LGEDGLEVAFEEGAGVLEVLFGVGFGGGDALKRFVEDADDPPLLGDGWNWKDELTETLGGKVGLGRAVLETVDHVGAQIALEVSQEKSIRHTTAFAWSNNYERRCNRPFRQCSDTCEFSERTTKTEKDVSGSNLPIAEQIESFPRDVVHIFESESVVHQVPRIDERYAFARSIRP
jgi:hypothetical protein